MYTRVGECRNRLLNDFIKEYWEILFSFRYNINLDSGYTNTNWFIAFDIVQDIYTGLDIILYNHFYILQTRILPRNSCNHTLHNIIIPLWVHTYIYGATEEAQIVHHVHHHSIGNSVGVSGTIIQVSISFLYIIILYVSDLFWNHMW